LDESEDNGDDSQDWDENTQTWSVVDSWDENEEWLTGDVEQLTENVFTGNTE
jgi:hypothetical protein